MLRNFLKRAAVVALPLVIGVSAHAEDSAITIANGKAKMNGLLKVWLINDTSLGHQTLANGEVNKATTNFRLRYAELKFSGSVMENTRWVLAIDPAKYFNATSPTDNTILQDYGMTYAVMPELELTVGNFKVLTTAESLDPTGELLFPERSMVARTFGDYREVGATVAYKTEMFKVAGMITNGKGGNGASGTLPNAASNLADVDAGNTITDPHPNNKNLYFRADAKPIDMVTVGAFTTLTDFSYNQLGVWGANVRVMPVEGAVVRFEGVRARQKVYVGGGELNLPRNGWVVDGGYQYGDWMPVARFEAQQAGGTSATDPSFTGTVWTVGMNYMMNKNLSKIQFAVSGLNNATSDTFSATAPTTAGYASGSYKAVNTFKGTLATLSFQNAF